jgi:hypothetical protein
MAWVQIQHAKEHSWEEHQKVGAELGDEPPAGLILRVAGEVDGRWKAVAIWESQEACDRFVQERIIPAVRGLFGEDIVAAGPPPTEWFEIKSSVGLEARMEAGR